MSPAVAACDVAAPRSFAHVGAIAVPARAHALGCRPIAGRRPAAARDAAPARRPRRRDQRRPFRPGCPSRRAAAAGVPADVPPVEVPAMPPSSRRPPRRMRRCRTANATRASALPPVALPPASSRRRVRCRPSATAESTGRTTRAGIRSETTARAAGQLRAADRHRPDAVGVIGQGVRTSRNRCRQQAKCAAHRDHAACGACPVRAENNTTLERSHDFRNFHLVREANTTRRFSKFRKKVF